LLVSVLCTVCSSKYSMRRFQCSACQSAGLSIARMYSGVHPDHDSRAVTCPNVSQNHERGRFAFR
jgi:formate dehydrogenase maturation protein FdhE